MSKSDLVIFLCSNAIVIIAISIIFMILYTSFVISKMKKIKEVSNECSNIILHNKIALEDDEKTCYSINKYNKVTLELLKEIRNVLTSHKGKYFDTQLLNIVEIELQQKLNKEKYKDLDYYNTSENTIKNTKNEENLNLNLYSLDNKSKKSMKFKIKIKQPFFSLISTTNNAIKKYLNSFKNKQALKINNYQHKNENEKILNLSKEITLEDLERKENFVDKSIDNKYVKSCSELKQMYNYDDIFNLEDLYLNLENFDKTS